MPLELPVKTSPVPENFCFGGFNSSSWLDILDLLYVQFPDNFRAWNVGSETPSPADRDKPWFRYNSDGTPDDQYCYAMGAWLAKHPDAPGKVILYEGTEASIDTFDGGEAGPVSDIGGPFWERVTQMNERFPIGPGTLPSGTVLAIGDQGGEEKVILAANHLPAHTHPENASALGVNNLGQYSSEVGGLADGGNFAGGVGRPGTATTKENTGGGAAHNNLPPYNTIWFLRRTSRLYRRI